MVGEIATRHLCVVLNKTDLLPEDVRPRLISKAKKRLAQTLAATTFAGCPMVAVSAKPGGSLSAAGILSPSWSWLSLQALSAHCTDLTNKLMCMPYVGRIVTSLFWKVDGRSCVCSEAFRPICDEQWSHSSM